MCWVFLLGCLLLFVLLVDCVCEMGVVCFVWLGVILLEVGVCLYCEVCWGCVVVCLDL